MKTSKFAMALGLIRESRKLYKAAIRCKGHQSCTDRLKLSNDLYVKAMWIMGRVSSEVYREYLS